MTGQQQTPAEEVRAIRRALGLSQARLAELLGTTLRTVNRWERGRNKPGPGILQLLRLLKAQQDARENPPPPAKKR
jgi:putative transcriptional regulator